MGRLALSAAAGSALLPITFATASDSSGSISVSVTSEIPIGGRRVVPLKMQSDIRSARSILWLCSPSTQEIASTTLDFPHPFGPTMQVIPVPLNVIVVFSQNDLNPNSSTLRSFSTRPSLGYALPISAAEETSVNRFGGGLSRQKRGKGRYRWPCRLALAIRRLREQASTSCGML